MDQYITSNMWYYDVTDLPGSFIYFEKSKFPLSFLVYIQVIKATKTNTSTDGCTLVKMKSNILDMLTISNYPKNCE